MEAIKTYLDNIFSSFPQNEQVKALKREMQTDMEEKYRTLREEGKSEDEAFGRVIANFGSIDEIKAELGVKQKEPGQEQGMKITKEEAYSYLEQIKRSGTGIASGVWIILFGVAALVFISYLEGRNFEDATLEALGVFMLLLAVAAAVVLFIVNGMKLSRYEAYTQNKIALDAQTYQKLKQESDRFTPRFTLHLAAGVVIILLSVGMLILIPTLSAGYDNISVSVFLLTVGFAVFLFITAGMTKSAYDVLLGNGDYKEQGSIKKPDRIIGTVASVYWPLIVVAFLLWSFIGNHWSISWMIWPIAGILFGAFAGGVSTWYGTKQ